MRTVCAIISNYRRPDNLEPLCRVLQREPCDIIVADNSPDRSSDSYERSWLGVMDIWCWKDNSGPPARWYPAVAVSHRYDYVVLIDDDAMLSPGLIDRLLVISKTLDDKFAVIGPMGRLFRRRRRGWRYSRGHAALDGEPLPRTDMSVRGYWIRGKCMVDALRFRDLLAENGATQDMLKQDDIIVNVGLQLYGGMPSYLVGGWYSKRYADEHGYAFSRTCQNFRQTRYDLIGLCHKLGWRSLARTTT